MDCKQGHQQRIPSHFNILLGQGKFGDVFGSRQDPNTAIKAIKYLPKNCKEANDELIIQNRIKNVYNKYQTAIKWGYVPGAKDFCSLPRKKSSKYLCYYKMERLFAYHINQELSNEIFKAHGNNNTLIHLVGYPHNLVKIVCQDEGDRDRCIDTVHFGRDGGQRGYNLSLRHGVELFEKYNRKQDLIHAFMAMASLASVITVGAQYFPWDVEYVFVKGPPNTFIPWRISAIDFGLCEYIPSLYKEFFSKGPQNEFVKFTSNSIYTWFINHDWYRPSISRTNFFLLFFGSYIRFSIGIIINKKSSQKQTVVNNGFFWEKVINKIYYLFMGKMFGYYAKRVIISILASYYDIRTIHFMAKKKIHSMMLEFINKNPSNSILLFQKYLHFDFGEINKNLDPKSSVDPRTRVIYSVARDILSNKYQLQKGYYLDKFNEMIPEYIDPIILVVNQHVSALELQFSQGEESRKFVEGPMTKFFAKEINEKNKELIIESWLPTWWPNMFRFMKKIETKQGRKKRKRKERKEEDTDTDTDTDTETETDEDQPKKKKRKKEKKSDFERFFRKEEEEGEYEVKKKQPKKHEDVPGISCSKCRKFFKASTIGMTKKQKREIMKMCKHCEEEPTTPEGYWDIGFFYDSEEEGEGEEEGEEEGEGEGEGEIIELVEYKSDEERGLKPFPKSIRFEKKKKKKKRKRKKKPKKKKKKKPKEDPLYPFFTEDEDEEEPPPIQLQPQQIIPIPKKKKKKKEKKFKQIKFDEHGFFKEENEDEEDKDKDKDIKRIVNRLNINANLKKNVQKYIKILKE